MRRDRGIGPELGLRLQLGPEQGLGLVLELKQRARLGLELERVEQGLELEPVQRLES